MISSRYFAYAAFSFLVLACGITSASLAQAVTYAPEGAHPNGTLILDGPTVYLIKDGERFGFRNAEEFQSHGYSFIQAVAANTIDAMLPIKPGNLMKALEGTLALDTSDDRTVYMVGSGGTKRGFVSEEVFRALGYRFENAVPMNLSDYPAGPVIADPAGAHPDGSLVLNNGTVWWVGQGQRRGFESEAVFRTYGFNYNRLVLAHSADMMLPMGPLVKFRDGTIVQESGLYFLISDGVKLAFESVDALIKIGYRTSNAIVGNLADYQLGGTIH